MTPYLNTAEAAALARISPKRLRNLIAEGVLQEGLHYTRPRGLGMRFKREVLVEWLEGRDTANTATPHRRPRCKLDLSLVQGLNAPRNGL